MNKKENKKRKISLSINEKLVIKLDEYLYSEDLGKRSKYIEKLIRDDMYKRGKDVSSDYSINNNSNNNN
jgi:metal-responsive CopG/Arc/MetJ family transcriptional regulator